MCLRKGVPCVYDTPVVYDVVVRNDELTSQQYSKTFMNVFDLDAFLFGLPPRALVRIFEKSLFDGSIEELT